MDKGLVFRIYKDILKLSIENSNNPIKKVVKDLITFLTKEDMGVANKHMNRCLTSLVIKEIQIKTSVRYHYTYICVARAKRLTIPFAGEDADQPKLL